MFNTIAWIGTDCSSASCRVTTTVTFLAGFLFVFLLGAGLLAALAILIYKYVLARKTKDTRTSRKIIKGVLAVIIAAVLSAAVYTGIALLIERKDDQKVRNAGFTMYATSDQDIYTTYLRSPGETTIPHVTTKLETPLGKINIAQANVDNEVMDVFRPPKACDIDKLYEYLSVSGKKDMQPTDTPCRQVPTSNGWTILTSTQLKRFGNSTPFAAIRGNTVMVFHAYRSSGEFSGTAEQAQEYILDYLNNVQPVDPDTLLSN